MSKSPTISCIGALIMSCLLGSGEALAASRCLNVIGYEWNPTINIDPMKVAYQVDRMFTTAIFEPLVDVDNNFGIIPVLAESWEVNAAATEWTIHLRQGVKFHDGSPFGAKDVIYTLQRLIDPANASSGLTDLGFIKSEALSAVDDHTVRIKLDEPAAELPMQLASKALLVVKDGTSTEDLQTTPNGTGPFLLREFSPSAVKVQFDRNPNYWQKGLPKADCITISSISEPVARAAAAISGEADFVLIVDASTVQTLRDSPNVTVQEVKGGSPLYMAMLVDTPPFDDVRVRQAMKLVVDREAILKTALLGLGTTGNDNPIPPTSPDAYRHDTIAQNIPKAKQLLVEAGYPDGLTVDLYTGDVYPGILTMVEAYRQMAALAGITVNTVITPADGYWDNIYIKKSFYTTYRSPRPPVTGLALTHQSTSPVNETHWKNADYDALLARASATIDSAARSDLYKQAQQMLAEQGGDIVPVFSSMFSAAREGCEGFSRHVDVNRIDYTKLKCE